jgi:hypothetical protein
MCFPLNTHLAFYSSFWGLLFWWLLAAFAATLTPRIDADRAKNRHGDLANEETLR